MKNKFQLIKLILFIWINRGSISLVHRHDETDIDPSGYGVYCYIRLVHVIFVIQNGTLTDGNHKPITYKDVKNLFSD